MVGQLVLLGLAWLFVNKLKEDGDVNEGEALVALLALAACGALSSFLQNNDLNSMSSGSVRDELKSMAASCGIDPSSI